MLSVLSILPLSSCGGEGICIYLCLQLNQIGSVFFGPRVPTACCCCDELCCPHSGCHSFFVLAFAPQAIRGCKTRCRADWRIKTRCRKQWRIAVHPIASHPESMPLRVTQRTSASRRLAVTHGMRVTVILEERLFFCRISHNLAPA